MNKGILRTEFRSLMKCLIRTKVARETKRVAVYMSGGVDSMTLVFACMDLGIDVHGYTFYVDEKPTADMIASMRAANMFGFELTKVNVPSKNLYEDFKTLADIGCRKKTHFECTWPMIYLFPQTEEEYIFGGYGADIHYGLSKKACMHHKDSLESLNEYREARFTDDNPNGVRQREYLAKQYGKQLVEPYMMPEMGIFFKQFTWDECNRPVEKIISLEAYREEFIKFGRRPHSNYQLVAKIPDYFLDLLKTDLNFKDRIRTMDLCRDHYERRWGK